MLGPVEDVTSITYQRLRQLIDAHVRPTAASASVRLPSLCFSPLCVLSFQHDMQAGCALVESAGLSMQHRASAVHCLPPCVGLTGPPARGAAARGHAAHEPDRREDGEQDPLHAEEGRGAAGRVGQVPGARLRAAVTPAATHPRSAASAPVSWPSTGRSLVGKSGAERICEKRCIGLCAARAVVFDA